MIANAKPYLPAMPLPRDLDRMARRMPVGHGIDEQIVKQLAEKGWGYLHRRDPPQHHSAPQFGEPLGVPLDHFLNEPVRVDILAWQLEVSYNFV